MDDLYKEPHTPGAEQAILGTLLTSPNLLDEVATTLTVDDFYRGPHKDIYETILRLADAGHPADGPTVFMELQRRNLLDKMPDGPAYLATLAERAAPAHLEFYADIVREDAVKRGLQKMHIEGLQQIQNGNLELTDLLSGTQTQLDEVAAERANSSVIKVDDSVEQTLEYMEELGRREAGITGVPTGFIDLDERTSGLHPGQMVVIAARPGVGKSTLGLDIARSAAIKHKIPTLIFSLEMSHQEITMRLISAEARVALQKIRTGTLEDRDWDIIGRKIPDIIDAPLFIDDTPSIGMAEIKARSRKVQQRHGLGLIIMDYLQLMSGDSRASSRQEAVSEMSRGWKLIAKELQVPVIVMSQLNRKSEERSDKRPATSDLRESGAIEQDADMILLLHREELGDPDSARVGEADIIIGKQRNGPTGVVPVAFQGHFSRFVDMQRD